MIPEIGHFALILALCVALVQVERTAHRRQPRFDRLDGVGASGGAAAIAVCRNGFRLPDLFVRGERLFGRLCCAKFQHGSTAGVSHRRRMGRA